MRFKKFRYRVDSNGRVAIKEEVEKIYRGDAVRLKVSVCLDKSLHIVSPCIFKRNVIVGVDSSKDLPVPIYYPLDSIVYIAVINIRFIGDNIGRKYISLYNPVGYSDDNRIAGRFVTDDFDKALREALVADLLDFVLERGK